MESQELKIKCLVSKTDVYYVGIRTVIHCINLVKIIGLSFMWNLLLAFVLGNSLSHSLFADEKIIGFIKSRDIAPYNSALMAFKKEFNKSGITVSFVEYDFEREEVRDIVNTIKNKHSDLILAIGTPAVKMIAENIKDIPIVFSMVLNPVSAGIIPNINSPRRNITGVSLDIPIKTQLEHIKATFPNKNRVGVIYNTEENKNTVSEAKRYAKNMGLKVVIYPAESRKEIPKIEDMEIDVLWLIPDTLVCQSAIIQNILQTTLKQRIPVIGISESYAKAGALLALSCDYKDIGKQSAEIALRILKGAKPADIPIACPRKTMLYLNLSVATLLEVKIPKDIIKNADEVFGK